MPFSWPGLLLAAIYLAVVISCAGPVIVDRSYGGIFSKEFALFVVTLPGSVLSEKPVKLPEAGRMAVYALSALLNGGLLYLAGWGLGRLAVMLGLS